MREGDATIPDPYEDDMALVLRGAEGLLLVCGCCHAGLLNTVAHVRACFGAYPRTIIGGAHLVTANEAGVRHVGKRLLEMGAPALYPNHCTDASAYVTLATMLSSRVSPCPAGTVLDATILWGRWKVGRLEGWNVGRLERWPLCSRGHHAGEQCDHCLWLG